MGFAAVGDEDFDFFDDLHFGLIGALFGDFSTKFSSSE